MGGHQDVDLRSNRSAAFCMTLSLARVTSGADERYPDDGSSIV